MVSWTFSASNLQTWILVRANGRFAVSARMANTFFLAGLFTGTAVLIVSDPHFGSTQDNADNFPPFAGAARLRRIHHEWLLQSAKGSSRSFARRGKVWRSTRCICTSPAALTELRFRGRILLQVSSVVCLSAGVSPLILSEQQADSPPLKPYRITQRLQIAFSFSAVPVLLINISALALWWIVRRQRRETEQMSAGDLGVTSVVNSKSKALKGVEHIFLVVSPFRLSPVIEYNLVAHTQP